MADLPAPYWTELDALREDMAAAARELPPGRSVQADSLLAYATRLGSILAGAPPDFGLREDEGGEGDSPDDPPDGAALSARPTHIEGGALADRSATGGSTPDAGVQEGAEGSRVGRPSTQPEQGGNIVWLIWRQVVKDYGSG